MPVFQSYLVNHLIKHLPERSPDNPDLLLYIGHSSHVSIPTTDWAKENNIVLFVLPAHTSHALQPMDVGCFGPFENIYKHECHKYIRMTQTKVISKYEVCELGCKTYVKALQPENLQSSFRRTGIYPFKPNIIDRSVFLPSTVFENVKEAKDDKVKEAKENETEEAGKKLQL